MKLDMSERDRGTLLARFNSCNTRCGECNTFYARDFAMFCTCVYIYIHIYPLPFSPPLTTHYFFPFRNAMHHIFCYTPLRSIWLQYRKYLCSLNFSGSYSLLRETFWHFSFSFRCIVFLENFHLTFILAWNTTQKDRVTFTKTNWKLPPNKRKIFIAFVNFLWKKKKKISHFV